MSNSEQPTPKTLLTGGYVISMDPDVGEFQGDVLVEDGRIAAIGPDLDPQDAEVVDIAGSVVIPGFVDSHRHLWEAPLRGRLADASLTGYIGLILSQIGPALTPDDLRSGTYLAAVEALDAGVTTVFDWSNAVENPEHADAAVEALRASGVRALFGHGNPQDAADVRRIHAELGTDGLVTLAVAMNGNEFGPFEAAKAEIELARELGVISSMHVGNGTFGRGGAVTALAEAGLLGPDLNLVHCATISDAEVALVVDAGANISSTPFVESLMGHGTPAFGRFLLAGGDPSLGTDVAVNAGADMFAPMHAALALARVVSNQGQIDAGENPDVVWPHAREVLHAATLAGARALGLQDCVGSLTVGKRADLVVLDGAGLPADAEVVIGAVVTAMSPADVDAVMVEGRWVKRNGALLNTDLRALRAAAAATAVAA